VPQSVALVLDFQETPKMYRVSKVMTTWAANLVRVVSRVVWNKSMHFFSPVMQAHAWLL
jgi:hypothetical protein